jgi:RNA polymerase sigma factor (sigma-70 family)
MSKHQGGEIIVEIRDGGATTNVRQRGSFPSTVRVPEPEVPPEHAHPESFKLRVRRWVKETRMAADPVAGLDLAMNVHSLLYSEDRDEQRAGATWLADHVPATPDHVKQMTSAKSQARWAAAIRRLVGQRSTAKALRELLIVGFQQAGEEAHNSQSKAVRLGRRWVKNASGKQAGKKARGVVPARDIEPLAQLAHWLATKAYEYQTRETRDAIPQGEPTVGGKRRRQRIARNFEEERRVRSVDAKRARSATVNVHAQALATVVATANLQTLAKLEKELTPARKKVFRLRFVEGLSVPEVAERLNITPRTVHNHIQHIKKGRPTVPRTSPST